MCDCLPTRLSGASMKLMMTDTDSIACSIHVPMLMRRNIDSGKLMLRSNSEKDVILSKMGSDKLKAHVELILSSSPEMRRIIDRAHFEENAVYFDESRKKVVGLYSDEVPLPKMIITFQCAGPKNYQLKKIQIRHKGIPQKVKVKDFDYSRLLLLWDKQYTISIELRKNTIQKKEERCLVLLIKKMEMKFLRRKSIKSKRKKSYQNLSSLEVFIRLPREFS